jgi:hypothetical protein
LVELSRAVGAQYFVHVVVTSSKRTYTVSGKLFGASEGQQLASEDVECGAGDVCPPLSENVRNLGQSLGVKALKEMRSAKLATAEPPVQPTAPPGPPIVTSAPSNPPTTPPTSPSGGNHLRVVPIVAIAAGVAAIGAGVYLVHLDGDRTDCQQTSAGNRCFQLWDTKSAGLVIGGLGLTSALAGAATLIYWHSKDSNTRVAVGPGGITAWGTF